MKKKKSKKKSLFKRFRGFTLVELLAVIVILAIIMIIAIPAVLNTLETSRKKTMLEFAQKVYLTGQRKFIEDKSFNNMASIDHGNYYYSIKDDLDLNNTGDFDGYFVIWVDGDYYEYHIFIYSKEYVLFKYSANNSEITENDLMTRAQYKQFIAQNYGSDFANMYGDLKNLNKNVVISIVLMQANLDCVNSEYDKNLAIVDASYPTQSFNACEFLKNVGF